MIKNASSEQGPIYIAGLERTGTSLMYALLASHPNIAMTRRTNLWRHFYGQFGELGETANLDACLDLMTRYKRLVRYNIDWEEVRRSFAAGEPTYGRLFALVETSATVNQDKPRWGDKSLHTERYFEAVVEAFPNVRVIHMIRDPRDRFASSQTRWERRRGGIGAGAAEWLDSVELAFRNIALAEVNYLLLTYEELVAEPEAALRRVCEFVGETYAPEMLQLEGAKDFTAPNSSYEVTGGQTISTRSVGRYRTVLASPQIRFIEDRTRVHMDYFGYQLDLPDRGTLDSLKYHALTWPVETLRSGAWRLLNSKRNRTGRPLPESRLVDVR
jgi:hypothetical protein